MLVIQKCIESFWLWSCVGHLGNPTVHNFGSFSTTPESATCRSWFLLQDSCRNTCRSHSWMCLERYTIKSAPTTDFLSHHAFKSFHSWTPEVSPPAVKNLSCPSCQSDHTSSIPLLMARSKLSASKRSNSAFHPRPCWRIYDAFHVTRSIETYRNYASHGCKGQIPSKRSKNPTNPQASSETL